MAYEILKTNGTVLTSIPDGQLVSSYGGLTLMGHKYPAIGTILNTDLVHIVENFASTTPPTNPLIGQLWYDSVSNTINFWNGNEFNSISVITSAETAPLSPIGGDEWFNTITNQLYIWSGNQWILVGPPGASGGGTEGLVVQSINVNGNQIYYIELYANNQLLGIISTEEILQPGIDGFGNIRPGLNFVISPTLGLASGGIFNINELTIGDSDQIDITLDSKDNLVLALNENNNGGNILIAATNGNTPSEISSLIGTVYVNNLVAIGSLSGNVPGADGHILFNNHGITDALLNLYASTDRSSINIPTILNVNNINANSEIINGPLSVSGSSTTNTLTVNLTANISTLDVTGTTTTSTLDVTGTTTTSTLDVTGNATIVGPASFQHPVTFNYSSANAFILPPSAGIIGQAVTSNGNGTTSWSNIAGAIINFIYWN